MKGRLPPSREVDSQAVHLRYILHILVQLMYLRQSYDPPFDTAQREGVLHQGGGPRLHRHHMDVKTVHSSSSFFAPMIREERPWFFIRKRQGNRCIDDRLERPRLFSANVQREQ